MWTVVGYTESQDSAVLVNVAALADQHVRVNGDDVIIPRTMNQLVAAYAVGPNITRVQLQSPSLRRVLNEEVAPLDVGALPSVPSRMMGLWDNPIILDEDEALNVLAAESAAGASRATALVFLADGPIAPVNGDIRTVRVTNATTLVANAWTNGALTFDQTLPAGRYAIVGARFRSTNLQAFRIVAVGYAWRPGAVGFVNPIDVGDAVFRMGRLGVWCEFDHNVPPTVDFLANGADSAQTGELDLIKL